MCRRIFQRDTQNFVAKLFAHFRAAREVLFERIYAFMIPTGQQFLRCSLNVRDVNSDVFRLADAVQAANPLFQ